MDLVRKTAESVRSWCIENMHQLNKRGYDKHLTGMCAIASAKLFDRLEQLGYTPTIGIAELDDSSHVFVLVDDFIVDVTATQFGRNSVEIIHSKLATDWYWQLHYECYSIKELLKHQKRNGWPSYQMATPDRVFYNISTIH